MVLLRCISFRASFVHLIKDTNNIYGDMQLKYFQGENIVKQCILQTCMGINIQEAKTAMIPSKLKVYLSLMTCIYLQTFHPVPHLHNHRYHLGSVSRRDLKADVVSI